ncbi:MAG: hypothetical protein NZ521_09155 [Flammeovirgaceae bacterium]|nr:hypothetical protein [Flammeovirgaceae bacterium]
MFEFFSFMPSFPNSNIRQRIQATIRILNPLFFDKIKKFGNFL